MSARRTPVSLVCVWNDEAVRMDCLDRSIQERRASAPDLEYVPIDNRGQRYTTAGAALNEGVRKATHGVVVFVQQDIYLHSLVALEEAAALLTDDSELGLLGAVGVGADGRTRGRIRDRVVLVGTRGDGSDADSLDEVLFAARREDLLAAPLSEDPSLAWHAYAVEWGLRVRSTGRRVVAVDIPITHNSLSTNVAHLDRAHGTVAALYPDHMPLQTTCGRIPPSARRPTSGGVLAQHRWRLRWLKGSWAAAKARRVTGGVHVVLGDLRWDIDRIASHAGDGIRIHNVTPPEAPFPDPEGGTRLRRSTYEVVFTSGPLEAGPLTEDSGRTCIWTNVEVDRLAALVGRLHDVPHVVGYQEDIGYWVLSGAAASRSSEIWADARSRPARLRP